MSGGLVGVGAGGGVIADQLACDLDELAAAVLDALDELALGSAELAASQGHGVNGGHGRLLSIVSWIE